MELSVLNTQGKDTGKKAKMADEIFAIEPNTHSIYLDVKNHLANRRQGTSKSKERSEIARTTKKFYRQKGTGNARVGSLRSPIHRGGGTAFGPRPRDYSFKLNKKVKILARKSALSIKAQEKNLGVLQNWEMDAPKTKDFVQILSALQVADKKSLIVLGGSNKSVYSSSRNLKGCDVITASELNTYKLVNAQKVFLTVDALEKLENLLSK